jgi:hypothetical protein
MVLLYKGGDNIKTFTDTTDYSFCKNSKCKYSNECKRFMIRESSNPVEINFSHICNQKNDYLLRIKMDSTELVVKEEDT